MTAAMASACDVSGAAHLPQAVAPRVPELAGIGGAVTVLRLEGFAPSVVHRRGMLEALMRPYGELGALEAPASRSLWQAVRDVLPFAGEATAPLWRLSTAPARGAELAAIITGATDAQLMFDWAGGLIWVAPAPADDAGAALVRRAVAATGGHATLIRAPAAMRAAIDVFQAQGLVQESGLAALTKRVKASFDPKGVLNPGRMWAGV
jgi:glycolate oxidase FAD binding subunit